MGVSKQDYLKLIGEQDVQQARDQALGYAQMLLRSAAVKAKDLVSRPEWEQFQSQLEQRAQEAERVAADAKEQLTLTYNEERASQLRVAYWTATGTAKAFREALMLPHEIVSTHQRAHAASPPEADNAEQARSQEASNG